MLSDVFSNYKEPVFLGLSPFISPREAFCRKVLSVGMGTPQVTMVWGQRMETERGMQEVESPYLNHMSALSSPDPARQVLPPTFTCSEPSRRGFYTTKG